MGMGTHFSVQHEDWESTREAKKKRRAVTLFAGELGVPGWVIRLRITRSALSRLGHESSNHQVTRVLPHSPVSDEAALIVVRFYKHLPPIREDRLERPSEALHNCLTSYLQFPPGWYACQEIAVSVSTVFRVDQVL